MGQKKTTTERGSGKYSSCLPFVRVRTGKDCYTLFRPRLRHGRSIACVLFIVPRPEAVITHSRTSIAHQASSIISSNTTPKVGTIRWSACSKLQVPPDSSRTTTQAIGISGVGSSRKNLLERLAATSRAALRTRTGCTCPARQEGPRQQSSSQ